MSEKASTSTGRVRRKSFATLDEVKKALLKDPTFRLEYDRLLFRERAGKVLQEARLLAGLTQEEVAKKAQTKQSVIARLESGRGSYPSLALLDKVTRVLGLRLTLHFERSKAA